VSLSVLTCYLDTHDSEVVQSTKACTILTAPYITKINDASSGSLKCNL